MNGIKQKSMAKLCFALSLFILAGVFRQIDYEIPPLPAAVCFMLTNLIYIGLAMAWGFSISSRILHRNVRRYLLLGCAIAPVCEELLFRRLLLERLRPYGERFALWASALCFGLFHGNFSQFFYACAIGVLFAGVVLKTGRLRQAMLLHALINFVGTGLIPLLSGLGEAGDWLLTLLVLAAMFVGLAFLPAMRREFSPAPGWKGLTAGEAWRCFLANPGMLCFLALFLLLAGSYLV